MWDGGEHETREELTTPEAAVSRLVHDTLSTGAPPASCAADHTGSPLMFPQGWRPVRRAGMENVDSCGRHGGSRGCCRW